MTDTLPPTITNVLEQKPFLKWIFIGGKGGVGKTTTSCSTALLLAKTRKTLLISTDPAHNLSDALGMKIGSEATKVEGAEGELYAMEIDPNASVQEMIESQGGSGGQENNPLAMFSDLGTSIPGIDEAISFAEIMKHLKSMAFDSIIFDTAPTGHTLRFLSFPSILENALGKLSGLSGRFAPLMNMMGMGGQNGIPSADDMFSKLEEMKNTAKEVSDQFQDPSKTTFVCVCISEFLSLYETERMIQDLASFNIDTHNIVVNQLLFPSQASNCGFCKSRYNMQQKYLEQINELYEEDFHIIKLPMQEKEVRGVSELNKFKQLLVEPFKIPSDTMSIEK